MFDEQTNATPSELSKKDPEDIFAPVESVSPPAPASSPVTPPMAPPSVPQNKPQMPNVQPQITPPIISSHKVIKIVGVIFGVVVLVGGGLLLARFLKKAPVSPESPAVTGNEVAKPFEFAEPPAGLPSIVNTAPQTQPEVAPVLVDTDGDGLLDSEETILGTNPNNPDTDADGLTDFDEVRVYKTNPLNPDTDGDSYKDGEEVKNGYNPNGPGKLFGAPTQP